MILSLLTPFFEIICASGLFKSALDYFFYFLNAWAERSKWDRGAVHVISLYRVCRGSDLVKKLSPKTVNVGHGAKEGYQEDTSKAEETLRVQVLNV